MTEHTPTPWHTHENLIHTQYRQGNTAGHYAVAETTGHASVDAATLIANAAFIVRACNAHDELVEACKLDRDSGRMRSMDIVPTKETRQKSDSLRKQWMPRVLQILGRSDTDTYISRCDMQLAANILRDTAIAKAEKVTP